MSENSSDGSLITSDSQCLRKDKLCLVCGDKALGYNFNAISCESCKAFFRRNAHKTIRGRCQGQCEVTVESRSFCKRCRQQKCFAVGMRKEMILNAEQKKDRKLKIIRNRRQRNGEPANEALLEEEEASLTSGQPDSDPPVKKAPLEVPSTPLARPKLSIINESKEAMGKLAPKHQALMDELEQAHERALQIPVNTSQKVTPSSATQFFNLAEGSVLRMVKLAKGLSAFSSMTKDDQIALLKGAVTEILMMRSAMYFDARSKSWDVTAHPSTSMASTTTTTLPDSSSDCPSGATQPGAQFLNGGSLNTFSEDTKTMFKEYRKFVTGLLKLTHGDLTVIKLMTVLALFSSDRPDVFNREMVQRVQELYANLLNSYVKVRFPEEVTLFPSILMKLTDIRNISEIHSKMLAKMNVLEVEPLLVEVFDLSQDG